MNEGSDSVLNETLQIISMVLCLVGILQVLVGPKRWKGSVHLKELVLIDLDVERITGEVMDLNHCLAYSPSKLKIKVGTYEDCKDAKMVVIAAGANQKEGETRLDLLNKNSAIFKDIIGKVMENKG